MTVVANPFSVFTDTLSQIAEGAQIFVGLPEQDPETAPKAVFWDEARTIAAAQPLKTVAGYIVNGGSPAIPYVDGDYSIRVRQANGAVVYYAPRTSDKLAAFTASLAAVDGAGKIGFQQAGTGAKYQNVRAKLRESLSLTDYLPHDADGNPTYVTDGSVDYTAEAALWLAVVKQSGAEAFVPTGIWNARLDVVGPIRMRGDGYQKAFFKRSGRVMNIRGEFCDFADVGFWSTGGDHCIQQTGLISQSTFNRTGMLQKGDGFSIWDNAGHEFIDMHWQGGRLEHTTTSTAHAFNLRGPGGTINDNSWAKLRVQFSGTKHFFNVETTTANAQYDNDWDKLTFEVCRGGGIRQVAPNAFSVKRCRNWDTETRVNGGPDTTPVQFNFYQCEAFQGIGALGVFEHCTRRAGTIAVGKSDISLPSGGAGAGVDVVRCSTVGGGDPFRVDAGSNAISFGGLVDALVSFSNASGMCGIDPTKGLYLGGKKVAGAQGAPIPQIPLITSGDTATVGQLNGVIQTVNAAIQRIQASTGHGLIGG